MEKEPASSSEAATHVFQKAAESSSLEFGSSLDLTGAEISRESLNRNVIAGVRRSAPSIVLPYQSPDYVNHIAIDIGGSLIKLVYFSTDSSSGHKSVKLPNGNGKGGRLHFVKFETSRLNDALAFIQDKGLHIKNDPEEKTRVVATGGGAHRFADVFREKLGLVLEKSDEMDCLVAGCNFFLKTIPDEAFTFQSGVSSYLRVTDDSDLYPYLLVNIGSGVSIVKVDGEGQHERVSGSSLGGGTFWGLCRLLTKVKNFDEMLELSMKGDNKTVDMLVGDIYGGRDYAQIGLAADTIASSFGKVVGQDKDLEDYSPADIALALCRMVSYNIGHLAYLNAMRYGLKRIIFGGFFIRGHPYTMDTISFAIRFWTKGSMDALFLRHEGFLGAMGAFLKVHPITPPPRLHRSSRSMKQVQTHFKELYTMGAPFAGGYVKGPAICDITGKVSWVEKFVQFGTAAAAEAAAKDSQASSSVPDVSMSDQPVSPNTQKLDLHVGVLHFKPSHRTFPLLADPESYEPNTIDINSCAEERRFWVNILKEQIPTVVEKAIASENGSESAQRRGQAFALALGAHLSKLDMEAYGLKGLADLLEMRELCLREFEFMDVYRLEKERENDTALQVLPDLLKELDGMKPRQRLLALVEGALAANIFDWGSQECIAQYKEGTILSIYKDARKNLSKRPWRVDSYDDFERNVFGDDQVPKKLPYRRVMMFVDNAGADIVLGMIPLAREFLKFGCEVVLVANSLPAINDITTWELCEVVGKAAEHCDIISAAWASGGESVDGRHDGVPQYPGVPYVPSTGDLSDLAEVESPASTGSHSPRPRLFVVESGSGSPCLDFRRISGQLAKSTPGTDLVVVDGMGRAIHTNFHARFKCDSLKLAMIKTRRIAENLFNGNLYDCVCVYEKGVAD
ncbi:hypothetical protein BSKO_05325 [Bryopsis sp. KO-2023]|nr:hypothetical protein BSKO_05325 [Bryopsis sp. KO-2023]